MTNQKTLVLAGNHKQYVDFLNERGIPTFAARDRGYYEGGSAGVVGVHVSRIVVIGTFMQREDAHKILQYSRACLNLGGQVVYENLPLGWYVSKLDTQGDPILRDENSRLRCNRCHGICSETYIGGVCSTCKAEETTVKKNKFDWMTGEQLSDKLQAVSKTEWKLLPLKQPLPVKPISPPYMVRKEGEIWQLPKANSPMWTTQWGYQGSAKTPYIISSKPEDTANGSTTKDGWACSCMNFTRHTPRTPCKHILNVQLKHGLGAVKQSTAKLASVDDAKMKAFEAWQREQAARKAGNKPTAGAKLNLFGATTRKFR